MKKFNSLLDAARFAATISKNWHFANSDETYIKDNLLTLAKISDSEDPIDEDSFYLVSRSGAIGLCGDGEEIDWLFLVGPDDEDLPSTYAESPELNFCSKCGSPIASGANFCDECGKRLF